MSKSDLPSRVRSIHKKEQTGFLRVRAPGWPDLDLAFMAGELIACGGPSDGEALGSLLVAAGAVSQDDLEEVRRGLTDGQDLADALVSGGVDGGAVMMARGLLFTDNVAWASIAPSSTLRFQSEDAVFPDNMQFGLVLKDVLDELKAWRSLVEPALAPLHEGREFALAGSPPEDGSWSDIPQTFALSWLLAQLGPPRRDALARIAGFLSDGVLLPAEQLAAPESDAFGAVSDEDIEAAPEADDEGGIDPEVEPDEAPRDHITQEDYEKAARGGFVKSYDVLDKVDLSGVEVIGAEGGGDPAESIPAIEAIGVEYDEDEGAIELGGESMEAIAAIAEDDLPEDFGTDTRPEVAPVGTQHETAGEGDLELLSDDFALFDGPEEGDAPPVQDVEIDFEAEEAVFSDPADEDEDDGAAAVVLDEDEDAGATGTFNLDDEVGVFDREQLNDFHHRIDVFNNIFRIIFKSFAEHIGHDKSQQRFNALLGSSQRQYPELFQNLSVDTDGTILPAPLINNLANCPPGDYGSLLHQGLYELIFSHLYDAKDMLPGNSETEMMEQIVVFERQLHQM